jgi:hypothetical protein
MLMVLLLLVVCVRLDLHVRTSCLTLPRQLSVDIALAVEFYIALAVECYIALAVEC